jgi:hypothetical protein
LSLAWLWPVRALGWSGAPCLSQCPRPIHRRWGEGRLLASRDWRPSARACGWVGGCWLVALVWGGVYLVVCAALIARSLCGCMPLRCSLLATSYAG